MIGLKIKEFLDEAGIENKLTKRSVVCNCPLSECSGEKKLYIEKSSGSSICFKCDTRWFAHGVLAAILNITHVEAKKMLYKNGISEAVSENNLKVNINLNSFFEETEEEVVLSEIAIDPLFVPVEISEAGMAYLAKRGVTDLNLIRKHDIRYSAIMNAVVFIIRDSQNRTVGWQARYIEPRNPKMRMMTSQGLNKSFILYNYSTGQDENLIITEGPFDCLKTDVPGYLSVASLGKGISERQVKLILESKSKNVFIGLDKDAHKEAARLAEKLSEKKTVFRIMPPENRSDFGDCDFDDVMNSLANAKQMFRGDKIGFLEVFLK